MILILSTEDMETSTEDVIDWLYYYNVPFQRINGENLNSSKSYSLELNNAREYLDAKIFSIDISKIKVIWLRKWNNLHHLNLLWQLESSRTAIDLFKLLNKELSLVSGSFFNLFSKKKWLTKPEALKVNKLDVLNLAKSVGFNVPDTIVTNSREICLCFLKKHEHIITKCISDAGYFKAYDQYHVLYTSQVGKTDLDNAPEYFYPSLFQKFIKKKYELRVFFLNDQCYAMAIFSQKNDKTKVDFRRYDNSAPNRTVPYKLPKSLQRKIISLMKRLCLNTGSIDLLVSSDNEYVFLEVNPVGQFGMVSKPCNFGLENIIAKYLISYDNE